MKEINTPSFCLTQLRQGLPNSTHNPITSRATNYPLYNHQQPSTSPVAFPTVSRSSQSADARYHHRIILLHFLPNTLNFDSTVSRLLVFTIISMTNETFSNFLCVLLVHFNGFFFSLCYMYIMLSIR